MEERRSFRRSEVVCNVTVIPVLKIVAFNARLENVGVGGVRIVLKERLDIATQLDIEISPLDEKKSIRCKGEVIWVNEKSTGERDLSFDTGIKFTNISKEDWAKIRRVWPT